MMPTTTQATVAIDAERAVLGGLMLVPESLSQIADWLTESDFARENHRLIFRAIADLAGKGQPCDAVTLADWFESNGLSEQAGGSSYVIELANSTPSAANIVAYAEIVREKSRLRQVQDIGSRLIDAAGTRGANAGDVAATAMHALSEMQATRARGGLQPAKALLRGVMTDLAERYNASPGLRGLPTPWAEFNRVTGGLRPGVAYVVGARPSMGKSIFGANVAAFNALRGERVALFSAEMTAGEMLTRMIAAHGQIPHTWLDAPNKADADKEIHWSRLTAISTRLAQNHLHIDDTPAPTIAQIMARARRAHLQAPLRLIVIDHLHDLGFGRGDNLRIEIGLAMQGAKTLAKELSIPVVVLAQLNRQVAGRTDKRPTLTDLRESGEIEQKADVIFFLHREDYYDRDTHLRGVVELIPAKGRNLRLDKIIYLANRFDQMRLDDWQGPFPEKPAVAPNAQRAVRSRGLEYSSHRA
ncbi:MAG: replicative DNA helicase [Rudaea sp.]|uniref:replicative DNA helicase n=1 Tax=Rudaea sp. TaxID=2136325 RepID=UPI0039E51532